MNGLVRHFAILGVATTSALFAYHYAANASVARPEDDPSDWRESIDAAVGTTAEVDLSRMRLLERTVFFVTDRYVEPERIDPEAMFDASLDLVERQVPEVLFRRQPGGSQLHVSVGSYTTTLPLPKLADTTVMVEQLERVGAVLQEHLSDEITPAEVEYAFINGVLSTLDPHSILLPPEQSREMEVDNAGEFGGLGINITLDDGRLTVERPLPDTPASRAGLKPDDRIVRIDGESTVNMDLNEAVSKLRGPVGAPVTITVRRASFDKDRDFTIVRDKIKINPVVGELMEGGVGYARINNFHAAVSSDLTNLLTRLRRENDGEELRGLILDLRGNPGGYLHQAVEVSDLFLSQGAIVSTVERGNRRVDVKNASRSGTQPPYSMVVLVNANSASASEIVAGALLNNGRAVVVGQRTFGKGSVQNLYKNPDDSQLKLTVAKYLTPNDQSIQSVGIPADIQLNPAVVDVRTDADTGKTDPVVALFYHERARREADLDHHLEWASGKGGDAVYDVRYLRSLEDDELRASERDLSKDWEAQFCRDLLISAPEGASRADILASVGPVIATHQRREASSIDEAFKTFGVDWAAGPQPASPSLEASLDLGGDGVVMAGEANEEIIQLKVKNTGDAPVYQVLAVADSGFEWLGGSEFFFGRIDPGETRAWPRRVTLPEGYPDEVGKVSFTLMDGSRQELATDELLVRTIGQQLPRFAWDWTLTDRGVEGTHGDGDGIAEPGETVALKVNVTNLGPGPTGEAFAKLKNRAGRDLDLQVGVAELGEMAVNESRDAVFLFKVLGSEPSLDVELRVGDQDRYDYAAIWQGGFYDHFLQSVELSVPVGKPMEPGRRVTPSLEITRAPALMEQTEHAVLSGMARAESGVRDVLVYHKSDAHEGKVFYQGGVGEAQALPFSAEITLDPGENTLVVLVRGQDGLSQLRSVNVWYDETGSARMAAAELPLGGG
ncbi:MAG: PDZ domain-containing protein [Alphaproteobacteria bacterium]|nr:PDZ domain-containing protein [Alphaproteobacteria bacterium]